MRTFIKAKFNISDDQTNIDKYRLAADFTEYLIISKLTFHHYKIHDDKAIISLIN